MINGLDIYYSKKYYGNGLVPISTNKKPQSAKGLKPISTNKGGSCKKSRIWIDNIAINLIFINNI